jgi:hypothetical protein
MGAPISSKDLLAEAGYTEPKGTVTISGIPKDKKIDLENLDPELYARIERMREDWKNNKELNPKGTDLPITRAASTAAEQEDLIRRAKAGEKNIFTPAPVPKGAKMVHQDAIDLPTSVPDTFLEKYGLHRPFKNKGDPVHVQINPKIEYKLPELNSGNLISAANLLKEAEVIPTENKTYAPTDVFAALFNKALTGTNLVAPREIPKGSMLEKLLGGMEAGTSAITGAITGIPAAIAYGYVPPGSPQSAYDEATRRMQAIQQFQYQPKTETGQNLMEMLGGLPKTIFGTSAPLPPMLGVESQLLGRTAYERPPSVVKKPVISPYALTEPPVVKPTNVVELPTLKGVGAAEVENNPFFGKLTGESYGRGEQFPQIKLSKISQDISPQEQKVVAEALQNVLKDAKSIRPGVLTGNEDTLRAEYDAASRADKSPAGQMLKEQIANEQNALTNFALERIEKTGANKLLNSDEKRGYALNNAVIGRFDPKTGEYEGMLGFIQKLKHGVYEYGHKKVGDNPVEATSFEKLLNSKKLQADLKMGGNTDFTTGLKELLEQHKTEGFTGTKPNSISGLEELRKTLNRKRNATNSYEVGQLISAIDEDIARVGGANAIEQGRQIHALEKTLFGSEGMKINKIFGEIDANGVKKGVANEKITQKLNDLPIDQWRHIYDTADLVSKGKIKVGNYGFKVPKDIIDQANLIKSEMKGAIAREIYQEGEKKIGVWNQNNANLAMNSLADKINYAFDPEEIKAFHELNIAGQKMPGVHSYLGGAKQAESMGLLKKGISKLPYIGGVVAGSATKGVGTGAGVAGGEVAQNLILQNLSKKDAAKMRETMQKNYNLGKLLDLKKANEE